MLTIRSSWYEAWNKSHWGNKLLSSYDTCQFNNQKEAKKAIKEAAERDKSNGCQPREFVLMIVDVIHTMEDDGTTISMTKTYARA